MGGLIVRLSLFTVIFDLSVQILYHFCKIGSQKVDIVVLQLYFFRYSFSERGYISQNLATLLHSNIKYFKLLFNILRRLLYLSRKFLNMFSLIFKPHIDCMEDSCFEDFGIVGYHEGYLIYFILVFVLVYLDFMKSIRCLEDTFLHRAQDLLNYLTHLGLHLEPFELFDLKFRVLIHTCKMSYDKIIFITMSSYHFKLIL